MTKDKDKIVDDVKYRAITEQGDLGLGADVLKSADQEALKEQMSENK